MVTDNQDTNINKPIDEDMVIFNMLEKARDFRGMYRDAEKHINDLMKERHRLVHAYMERKVITNDETNSMIWLIKQNNKALKAVLHII